MRRLLLGMIGILFVLVVGACSAGDTGEQSNINTTEALVNAGDEVSESDIEDASFDVAKKQNNEDENEVLQTDTSENESNKNTDENKSEESKQAESIEESEEESSQDTEMKQYEIDACEEIVLYAKKTVNIRIEPSSSSDKIGTLKKGNTITVNGNYEDAWFQVLFEDGIGYISANYLISVC